MHRLRFSAILAAIAIAGPAAGGAVSAAQATDEFQLDVVIQGVTVDTKTGVATVTATNYCTIEQADATDGGFLVEQGSQSAGAELAPGCSPSGRTWSASTAPGEGDFHPGRITVSASSIVVFTDESGTLVSADDHDTEVLNAKATR